MKKDYELYSLIVSFLLVKPYEETDENPMKYCSFVTLCKKKQKNQN